jgi:four helix bundle protein
MAGKRFEELPVWMRARELVRSIYEFSDKGAFARDFALRDQIRRAAVSVVSNVAEGYERDGNRELLQFLYVAKGSCGEVRAQVHVARDLGYLDEEVYRELVDRCVEISRMLAGLIGYLKRSDLEGRKYR